MFEVSASGRDPDDGSLDPPRLGAEPFARPSAEPGTPSPLETAAAALNLAMRVGDCLLSAGMSANDVVVVLLRITTAYQLTRVHIDVTYTSISASYYPGRDAAPITCIRVVRPDVVDYSRVRELDKLSDDIQSGLTSTTPSPSSNGSMPPHRPTRSGCRRPGTRVWARRWRCCSPRRGRSC